MSRVEVLATGIKIESSNQRPFWGPIKGSRVAKINRSKTHGCNLTFNPLKTSAQGPQKETIKQFLPIKSLDPGHKHLNRQHVSDYLLVLHCNKLWVLINSYR